MKNQNSIGRNTEGYHFSSLERFEDYRILGLTRKPEKIEKRYEEIEAQLKVLS